MKVIIYKTKSHPCHVIHPTPEMFDPKSKTRKELGINFKNDQEILEWIVKRDVPKGMEYSIIDDSELPKDRIFRDAWIYDPEKKSINIDLEKSKEIHKNRLRILRKPLLESLDIEYQKADAINDFDLKINDPDLKKVIIQNQQELRDITKDLPDDLEKLKSYFPEILKIQQNPETEHTKKTKKTRKKNA